MALPRLALAAVLLLAVSAQAPCNIGQWLLGPDMPGQPVAIPDSWGKPDGQACSFACMQTAGCRAYNYAAHGQCGGLSCPFPNGCCWLKSGPTITSSNYTTVGGCGCSIMMRPDPAALPPAPPSPPSPPPGARNVLYVLVDDLRPDVAPYGAAWMVTPAVQSIADAGVTFSHAYCNIAVCSPSRQSFLTGRYPHHTQAWNFLNHFRQGNCGEVPDMAYSGPGSVYKAQVMENGGAGQCCTTCTEDAGAADPSVRCAAWTLTPNNTCLLLNSTAGYGPAPGHIAGVPGTTTSRSWVTLPQHFRQAGWLTTSSGKIFHSEEGGIGPAPWDGVNTGMPPLQDPPSWSDQGSTNTSMANTNAISPMRPCAQAEAAPGSGSSNCSARASLYGEVEPDVFKFSDRMTGDDAVQKLEAAAAGYAATGRPFFVAVGFRKPHLPFRHPAPWDSFYPSPDSIPLARYKVMDTSVPPIAYHTTSGTPAAPGDGLAKNPYIPLPDAQAGILRRDYYAATSWMDWNLGRVLGTLQAAGPAVVNNTLVVFHSDHGWSLGEHGEWEKFTNWEHGTRVPLIISAPWLANTAGTVVNDSVVELVDVYPTIAELAGLPVPASYGLDGASLVPDMGRARPVGPDSGKQREREGAGSEATPHHNHNHNLTITITDPTLTLAGNTSSYALSVYPRCPYNLSDPSGYWYNGDCLYIERSTFPIMGVSLRTGRWRYTEWRWWNGTALAPVFGGNSSEASRTPVPLSLPGSPHVVPDPSQPVGVELYDHTGDDGTTFDGAWEVVNLAGQQAYAGVQAQLAAMIRQVYPYHG